LNQEDKDLILLAAEAYGIEIEWREELRCFVRVEFLPYYIHWNPLQDSDHALTLLAFLCSKVVTLVGGPGGVCIKVHHPLVTVDVWNKPGHSEVFDAVATTRRVITTAASKVALELRGKNSSTETLNSN